MSAPYFQQLAVTSVYTQSSFLWVYWSHLFGTRINFKPVRHHRVEFTKAQVVKSVFRLLRLLSYLQAVRQNLSSTVTWICCCVWICGHLHWHFSYFTCTKQKCFYITILVFMRTVQKSCTLLCYVFFNVLIQTMWFFLFCKMRLWDTF